MIDIRGHAYTPDDLARYFGDPSCVAGVRRFELREGRARGTRITEVRTGSGLAFEVNESRGMDLGRVSYRGIPVSYASYNGEVAPNYYEPADDGWLRSYAGGLLVTCGLSSTGSPEVDGGERLPMHGRISNIPAEGVCVEQVTTPEGSRAWRVSGYAREAKALNSNLVLKRTITAVEGEKSLLIEDEVENQGFEDTEFMLLYHFNIGHPVIDEGSRLLTHSTSVVPRDEDAAAQPEPYNEYLAPTPHYKDIVYYHELESVDGRATSAIINESAGLGVYLAYETEGLDCFTQWKFLGEGNYVAGMEPGNAYVGGRSKERAAGRVKILPARSSKHYKIKVGLLTSAEEIDAYKRENKFA